MLKLNEQFDVLSNTLRVFPEEVMRLNYFINELNDPEEGIGNIEIACLNVFNNIYGLMCALKEEGATASIYEHDAITTALCIRHILQHQSGRLGNNLRDAFTKQIKGTAILVKYNVSNPDVADQPFFINLSWLQEGISNSNNAKRLEKINKFWNFPTIRKHVEASGIGNWRSTYVCSMSLIKEAVRTIFAEYSEYLTVTSYDSKIYFNYFKSVKPVLTADYGLVGMYHNQKVTPKVQIM